MKSFCRKRWARALALILFCLFTVVSFLCGFLYNYGLQDGWYGEADSFEDSALCRTYIQDCLYYVAENLLWLGDPTDTTLGDYGGDSFSYTITRVDTGEVVADTTTADSVYVMDYDDSGDGEAGVIILTADAENEAIIYASESTGASATPEPLPADSASASDTEADDVGAEAEPVDSGDGDTVYYLYTDTESGYIISGYVNLPVEPYDGCYGEYFIFTHLYAGRDYYLAACVGSGLLALMLLAFALAGAILAGKNGEQPARLCRMPFEVLALGLYLCALFLWNALWELAFELLYKTAEFYVPFSLFNGMLLLMAAELFGYILAAQIAAKLLLKNSLLRRMAAALSMRPILRVLIVIAVGGQAGLGLFVMHYDGSYILYYLSWLLLAADVAILAVFIRWCMEERSVRTASQALSEGDLTIRWIQKSST